MKVLGEACSEILDGTFGIIPDVTFRRDSIKNFEDNSKVTSKKRKKPGNFGGNPRNFERNPRRKSSRWNPKRNYGKKIDGTSRGIPDRIFRQIVEQNS